MRDFIQNIIWAINYILHLSLSLFLSLSFSLSLSL